MADDDRGADDDSRPRDGSRDATVSSVSPGPSVPPDLAALRRAAFSRGAVDADRAALLAAEREHAAVLAARAERDAEEEAERARRGRRAADRRGRRRLAVRAGGAVVAVAALASAVHLGLLPAPAAVTALLASSGGPDAPTPLASAPSVEPPIDPDAYLPPDADADAGATPETDPGGAPLDLTDPVDLGLLTEAIANSALTDATQLGQLGGWAYVGGRTSAPSSEPSGGRVCLMRVRVGVTETSCVSTEEFGRLGVGFNVGIPLDPDAAGIEVSAQYATGRVVWAPTGELAVTIDERER